MVDCKVVRTPLEKGFEANMKEKIVNVPYRELIGSLMYISTISRPDIIYAVSYLHKFVEKPTSSVWNETKRVVRYLNDTKTMGITFQLNNSSDSETLTAFSDADWGSDRIDRNSISGSLVFLKK